MSTPPSPPPPPPPPPNTQASDTMIERGSSPSGSMRGGTPLTLIPVLWQLVMQCCDQSSLLWLARCSRELLRAASHVCAWTTLAPIRLSARTIVLQGPRILGGLVRFATTDVTFDVDYMFYIDQMMSIPRVRIARIRSDQPHHNVGLLLADPMLANIRTLHLYVSFSVITPLVFPPQLETVHMSGTCAPSVISGLAALEHLTCLDLTQAAMRFASYVDTIRTCTHLRVVRTPRASGDSLNALCRPGRLLQLRELDVGPTVISERTLACVMNRPPLHTLVIGNQRLGGLTILWDLARNAPIDTSLPPPSPLCTLLLVVSTAELQQNYIEQIELPVDELELFGFWYARGARVVFRLPQPSDDANEHYTQSSVRARVKQLAELYPDRVHVEGASPPPTPGVNMND